ncbi:cell division protein FtsQ [Herbaspirillum huttiense F1]|uniref:alginate O-acetyltransferase AlgX-related protein n=1 Tax=Herbaspirillum huttiense TaxID=863372 RepID=UPI00288499DB|nr:cell division protein FtsQ [Herbaspirillum huttiense]MDT0356621.1 cell division protein FtsQ [Herbaspirillum huttiense F1]
MSTPPVHAAHTPPEPSAMARRASRWAGAALAAVLCAGLISCGWLVYAGKIDWLPASWTRDDALHGELTHQLAKQLSNAWLPDQAAKLERAGSWLLLGDTGPRVRTGCPGWLFLAEELQVNRHAQANAQTKRAAVLAIRQALAQRGIGLLVAVVPDKSRIAASALCGLTRPAELNARAAQWVSELNQDGVAAIDLAPTLAPLGASAYLHTDTHWNETGANAAAQAIAARITAAGVQATPQQAYTAQPGKLAQRPGDLVHLAGLDWLPLRWQPTPESVAATVFTEAAATGQGAAAKGGDDLDDLLGDSQLPNVALIGTSFSRNSNFVGFLQMALGAKIGSFAKDGGKFSGSARDYFANPAFTQTPPKLVVWEIPGRDLQTPYEAISLAR